MAVYLRTRRIAPRVIAHRAVDVVDFAGVVPEAWFRFGRARALPGLLALPDGNSSTILRNETASTQVKCRGVRRGHEGDAR